jgi:hypothetical protein
LVIEGALGDFTDEGDLGLTIVLRELDDEVVWVVDQPERHTGMFDLAVLVESWEAYGFATDPPQAAVVVDARAQPDAGASDVLLVELTDALLDSTGLTLSARRLIEGPGEGLADYTERADPTLPPALVEPRVFVDLPALPAPGRPEAFVTNNLVSDVEGQAAPTVIVGDPRPTGPPPTPVVPGDEADLGLVRSLVVTLAAPVDDEDPTGTIDTGQPERESWIVTFPGGDEEYRLLVSQIVDPFAEPPVGVEVRKRCWSEERGNFDC